jgi:integrase
VPLDAALAESLLKLRLVAPYNRETDWVFASPTMKAIRWEWTDRNPIKSVRQSAKRMRTPDVLTPEEIMALLKELPEPLRTAAELDAFTGLRRGELIGLQWEDVDFENLVIHVRRSVVMMVQGAPKTEASAKASNRSGQKRSGEDTGDRQ